MNEGIVLDGGLHEASQEGGLEVVQFGGGLREVALRGGLNAVGNGAEGRDVQVAGEDFVFRLGLLQGQRVLDFAELTLGGLLGSGADLIGVALEIAALSQRVAHVLLGDRGGTLTAGVAQVRHERAGDTGGVHAVVLVEALILDRDNRLLHDVRNVRAGNDDALLVVEVRNHRARRVEDLRFLSRGDSLQVARQLVEHRGSGLRDKRGGPRDGDEHACSDDTHQS